MNTKNNLSGYVIRSAAAVLLFLCALVALASAINLPSHLPKFPVPQNNTTFGANGHDSAASASALAIRRDRTLTFADRVTTPLLIQHGEADPRVPIAGAWKFYRTLKALGKTVEFDIYPRGGHVLREPMQQREQMRRNLDWFMRWVK